MRDQQIRPLAGIVLAVLARGPGKALQQIGGESPRKRMASAHGWHTGRHAHCHRVQAMRVFVILMFLAIVYNMGRALLFIFHDQGPHREKAVRALTWRVALSFALLLALLLAKYLGWPQDLAP
jgi:Protein of unknown function (DUF2909)